MTPTAGRATEVDLDAVRQGLGPFPVPLALVFGSTVQGSAHAFSDVDVGVVFERDAADDERGRLCVRISAELSRRLGTDDVDVVDLERVPAAIAYAALATGELVVGEEDQRIELEARMLQQKLDFEPIVREWHDALEERLETGAYGGR